LVSWSPDSTRVATWVDLGHTIGIYGLDGARQALLSLPEGLMAAGDFDPVWSPDGSSLLVPHGVEIPLDGSAPRQLPAGDPRSWRNVTYSPDGAHVAYVSVANGGTASLAVADADGTHARVLFPSGVETAVWSPTGDRVAFVAATGAATTDMGPATELDVVDVASATVTSLLGKGGSDSLMVIEYSPDGGQILYSRTDSHNVGSLWGVNADGSDPHLLVAGTLLGDWQALSAAP
jgi:Tol biopolymer transport system component